MSSTSFRNRVWRYYRAHGRHELPWRQTRDLYQILVSEVMLQQTQVERVVPFYTVFIKKFPTAQVLAKAPLSDTLVAWIGLGYNRRAKMLREAAAELAEHRGRHSVAQLEALSGVGPYTARAVATFAYNADGICIETNIRTVVIHHFFPDRAIVSDKEITAVLERTLPKGRAREWYWALMDYGAYLKRSGVRVNTRSAQYAKQAKFQGSLRQVRGAILKAVTKGRPLTRVRKEFPDRFDAALAALARDGLIEREGRLWRTV